MSTLDAIARQAGDVGLCVAAIAPVEASDNLPPEINSVVLLGPDEPGFWPMFLKSPEYGDGQPDALDRWSTRVIGTIANQTATTAHFPFGGPPYAPFLSWAQRSGRCWSSPVGLLVHDTAGLFVSFRGALGLQDEVSVSWASASPCESCEDKPCKTACPIAALTPGGYNVPACKDWLATSPGAVCHGGGCLVRRSCPVGAGNRSAAQSAYHMKAFRPL